MLQKTQGIVLHSLKYKDTSIIVDIYTEVSGRASFLVPVSRSRKAAVKSVLFQPLSLVELEADFRPNTTIYKVKEAKSLYPLLRFLTILISLPSLCFCPSSYIVRCARKRKTVLYSLICSIPLSGWMNAAAVLPTFIWSFDAAVALPRVVSESGRLSQR